MKEKRLGRGLGDILTTLGKVIPKPALRPAEEARPPSKEETVRQTRLLYDGRQAMGGQVTPKPPLEEKVLLSIPPKNTFAEFTPPSAGLSVKEMSLPLPSKIDTSLIDKDAGVATLRIDDIIPNRFQPRKEFDPEGLKELTESIKTTGVIQPVLVRASGSQYELI